MWDALDSVYAAAVQDERFDVKVIPIPYYSLDARGEIQQAHYEGAELGKLVPVTDYRTYSIPLELPDVIFIHNPYDGCNRVTRVFDTVHTAFGLYSLLCLQGQNDAAFCPNARCTKRMEDFYGERADPKAVY